MRLLADEAAPGEELLVSREQGKALAEAWDNKPKNLNIPNTLLTSQHIIEVVKATGVVAPFFFSEGLRKDRLKKAAYEGRIGNKAFKYEDRNCPEQIFDSSKDEYLKVPKNSIVFVESDLDFRIPDFIAMRFNLQIRHVHRGLLLGTGPLIDPGFWGKLCIPLHNLTDEDYEIPRDEGLIWIEFTKTTLPSDTADKARGPKASASERKEYWDIEKFLRDASEQYRGHKVPIKSSLPTMFDETTASAKKSAEDAKSAFDEARSLRTLNLAAIVSAAIALVALTLAFIVFGFNWSVQNKEIADRLSRQVKQQQDEIRQLSDQVEELKAEAERAQLNPPNSNRQSR